ncbi:MAG: hypothetical protein HYZ83_01550 [Candidatus Omnitrophica bacterium]|nr:hypothetical protein [Candidatus Omnitrophota bacterium]
MRLKNSSIFLLVLTLATFLFSVPSVFAAASVTNKGNDTVEIKAHKADNSIATIPLDPGRSEFLPAGTYELMVVPHTGVRADQVVSVNVVNDAGKETTLDTYWKVHKLNEAKKAAAANVTPYVTNSGNVAVNAIIKRATGAVERRMVYIGESIYLPYDTVDVDVDTIGGSRGDEVINLSVVFPNGKKKSIKKG